MDHSGKKKEGKGMPVSYLSKKLSPYVRVAAIIVVAALMAFAGLRFYSWRAYGARTRLITLVNPWNPVSETGYSVISSDPTFRNRMTPFPETTRNFSFLV